MATVQNTSIKSIGKLKLHLGSVLLAIVGAFDLISTLYWLSIGGKEGNPLFAQILSYGVIWFILAKIAITVFSISILEYARRKKPQVGEMGIYIALTAYTFLWLGQIYQLGIILGVF